MQKQLTESQEGASKGETRLSQAINNIRALQDERSSLEAKLSQKQAALTTQVSN